MASASITPRNRLVLSGLQLVTKGGVTWAEKEAWLRNPPYTAANPTPGQLEVRIKFGETAHTAKGTRGLRAITKGKKTGKKVPGAAAVIAEAMTGYLAPSREDPSRWESRLRRTLHTLEELREIYARKTGKAAPGPY
jgi:hypothetical protein